MVLLKISVHFGSDDKLLEPRVEKFVVILALQMLLGATPARGAAQFENSAELRK